MRVLQWVFTYFATIGLLINGVPTAALAKSQAKPVPKIEASEITKEAGELLKSSHPKETFSEMYYRLAIHLSGKGKNEFAPLLRNKGKSIAPDVTVDGDEIVFALDGQEARLKIVEKDHKISSMTLNGQILSPKELASPKLLVKTMEKILSSSSKKTALFWPVRLFIPEAHAFDFMTLALGAALGAGAFWAYKEFIAGDAACRKKTQCCLVNNTYATGCCSQMNGAEEVTVSTGSCPVGTSLNGDVSATGSVVPESDISETGRR